MVYGLKPTASFPHACRLKPQAYPKVLWPSGEGGSFTRSGSRVRVPPGLLVIGFETYWCELHAQIRQSAERLGLNPSDCEFESHSGQMTELEIIQPSTFKKPSLRRAVRSARHPVTVEVVGSNPIGDAFNQQQAAQYQMAQQQTARYANGKAAKLKPS